MILPLMVRSAKRVSNHEARSVACILRDAASRLLRMRVTRPHGGAALRTEKFQFAGEGGHQLAAALDLPDGEPSAYALFAHCFTCGKDVLAAERIATGLSAKGIATLRFDFTGLGSSEGDFANATFSSNVADLVRAADHL